MTSVFKDPLSEEIWRTTYKYYQDNTIQDTWRRVAKDIASAEETDELKKEWEETFYEMMEGFKVVPGGRIMVNAGTEWEGATYMNCLAGETKVHTLDGIVEAKDLKDKTVKTLSKDGVFRDAIWKSYGSQKLYKVTFSNDEVVYATKDHKWVSSTPKGGFNFGIEHRVNTIDLAGRRVPIQGFVVPEYDETAFKAGFAHGMVYGDGWETNNRLHTTVAQFNSNTHLIPDNFESYRFAKYKGVDNAVVYAENLPGHYKQLPSGAKNMSYLRGFVAGLIATDGSIDSKGHVTLFQASLEDIEAIRQICANAGIPASSLCLYREASPWDDTIKPLYCLRLFKSTFWNDRKLVAKNKHKEYLNNSVAPKYVSSLEVISVEETDRTEEVYCCEEPETHTIVIGSGILTGQCYVGPLPGSDLDSIDSIYKVLQDQANTLKSEGGWGMSFSWLRPRGSFIQGVGVESPGAVKFMELFDKSSEIVTSGSGMDSKNSKTKGKIRKGAMMGVLEVWHPDILEFITAKQTPGRLTKFNVSVNCTDDFMEKVNHLHENGIDDDWELVFPDTSFEKYTEEWRGDIKAWKAKGYPVNVHAVIPVSKLWDMIMRSTYTRNEPGVLFLDRANYYNPLNYAETILATNPCVTGDTLVLTDKGYFKIEDLVGNKVKVWNGNVWSEVEPKVTAENQDILDLVFSDGTRLSCTPYHAFILKGNEKVEARDLKVGDKLEKFELPVVQGDSLLDSAYSRGVYSGDGTRNTNQVFLYGTKKDLLQYLDYSSYSEHKSTGPDTRLCVLLSAKDLTKTFVPTTSYTVKSRLDWLAGLLDTDGSIVDGCGQITSIDKDFLYNTKLMLTTLGVPSVLSVNKVAQNKLMPDGKGGQKEDCWRLSISASGMQSLVKLGLTTHRLSFAHIPQRNASRYITLLSISGRKEKEAKVYCFNEPINHTGIFNGILTGQCGEQTLAPGGVCDLGTINLTQFIREDRKGFDIDKVIKYVKYLVRFLDNVNSISEAPLPEYLHSMNHKRRIGCGVMGYGSSLYMMKVKFGSEEANAIREELLSAFAKAAYEASIDLAIEKGPFSYCEPEKHAEGVFVNSLGLSKEYTDKLRTKGIRNSALLSNQPNGNSSMLVNIVSGGIEPIFLTSYIRTKICPTVPEEIKAVTPNFAAGIFEETDFFKWAQEGDEKILRGVTDSGKVYKIDRNRGLTEEVLCEDYGVRYLKEIGEWDPNAEWAVTTESLPAQVHVDELAGFSRWVDSACSKTCNVPNDYSYEDFRNLYLSAYNTGVIKGFTTYRAGTMASVLSAKEEASADPEDEEIILDETKLPDSLPCTLKTLKAEGRKWYLTLVMDESQKRPVALFANTNSAEKNTTANDAVEKLGALAVAKGIPSAHIESVFKKVGGDSNTTKICRLISLNLRHGVLVKNVVHTLDEVDCIAGSFVFHIRKFLATWIKDGEKVVGQVCSECGSVDSMIYQEGCKICKSCGSSKCG